MEFEIISEPDEDDQFEIVSTPDTPEKPGLMEAIQYLPLTVAAAPALAIGMGEQILKKREVSRQVQLGEISEILGPSFDPSSTYDDNFLLQMDISRSDELSQKQKKFRSSFPQGDLIEVMTKDGGVLLAREGKDQRYKELDFGPKVAGAIFSEPVVGGVVGSFFTPLGTILGTIGGLSAKHEIEKARGYEEGDLDWLSAFKEGGIAGAVDALTRGVLRVVLGPRLPIRTASDLKAAVKGAAEEGLEPIATGQVGGPLKRGLFGQAGAVAPRVEQKIAAQERSLLEAFKRLGDDFPAGTTDESLRILVKAQQRELQDLISIPGGGIGASNAIQEGLLIYEKASKRLVGRLYDKAIATSDDIAFNLRPAQKISKEIDLGVLSKGKPLPEGGVSPVRVSSTPEGQLAKVVDDINALAPTVEKFSSSGQTWTAFEQIKTLRTRLFHLKQSDDGAVRFEANRLYKALTEVMDSPISGNPKFVEAYKKASMANFIREGNLSKTFVARALKTDTPEVLARKYFTPGHLTELKTIKDLIPRPQWRGLKQSFLLDLIDSPTAQQGISKMRRFQAVDKEGWDLLIEPSQAAKAAEYLIRRAQFEASPARTLIEKNLTEGEKIIAIARNGTAADVADAVRLSGGKESNLAKSMRAGIYKSILDEATVVTERGTAVLDANIVIKSIQAWMKSGRLKDLMTDVDWRRLANFQRYSAVISDISDIGGPMMAGALRQKIIHIPTDILFGPGSLWHRLEQAGMKVVRPIVSNNIAAWLLSRPASYSRLAMASGKHPPIRELAIALTVAREEYE